MHSIEIFRTREPKIMGIKRSFALMFLVVHEEGEDKIILEKRAMSLKSQPGDICLPGGGIEEGETPAEAAIRETMEELNIDREDIELIGPMDYFISPYGHTMYPFVARMRPRPIDPSPDEVDQIIKVPIRFFMEKEPLIYDVDLSSTMAEDFPYHLIENGKNYSFRKAKYKQYFYRYQEHVVWGFTAQVIQGFLDALNEEEQHEKF